MAYAFNKDSDQPGHPPCLIRVIAKRMTVHVPCTFSYSTAKTLMPSLTCIFAGRTVILVLSYTRANITSYVMFLNMITRLTGSWTHQYHYHNWKHQFKLVNTYFTVLDRALEILGNLYQQTTARDQNAIWVSFQFMGSVCSDPGPKKKFCKKIKLIKTNSLSVFGCLIFYWKHGTQQCFKVR